MADYNSPNTGVEIDAAVAATNEIMIFEQVYNGSPTNAGVAMSSISVNPGTGDKTGIYDIIWADTNTSVHSSSGKPHISRIFIGDIAQTAIGSSHTTADGATRALYTQGAEYDGTKFTCIGSTCSLDETWANSEVNEYIHEIWRLQKLTA